jgi:hypothetical protein
MLPLAGSVCALGMVGLSEWALLMVEGSEAARGLVVLLLLSVMAVLRAVQRSGETLTGVWARGRRNEEQKPCQRSRGPGFVSEAGKTAAE